MTLDVTRLRAETPGCAPEAGGGIALNAAGAALPSRAVLAAVTDHLHREALVGGYQAQADARETLDDFAPAVAALLNARPEEIAFVENATRAWALAFAAVPLAPGQRVLTGRAEYASNYMALLQATLRRRVTVEVIPDDADGVLDVAALEARLGPDVGLLALTHVPTHDGLVTPVAAAGARARAHGVPFLLDACQSAGQLPLDVEGLGCDMLVASGRKYLRGPRGTGFLYVRAPLLPRLAPPFVDLQSAAWVAPEEVTPRTDAARFEVWERFVAGQLGLTVAVREALALGVPALSARIQALADTLRTGLRTVPGVTLHDHGPRPCGIVTLTRDGVDATALHARLTAAGVYASVSPPGHARLHRHDQPPLLRLSPHVYNTEQELDTVVRLLADFS